MCVLCVCMCVLCVYVCVVCVCVCCVCMCVLCVCMCVCVCVCVCTVLQLIAGHEHSSSYIWYNEAFYHLNLIVVSASDR